MKRATFVLLAAATAATLSCNRNELLDNVGSDATDVNMLTAVLKASVEDTEVKTNIDGKRVLWQADDAIKVYTAAGAEGLDFTLISGEGTASADFEGSLPENAQTLWTAYPASGVKSLEEGDILEVELPSLQTISDGNVARGALVAVAKAGAGEPLSFRNVFSLVKVTISSEDIKAFVLQGNGISGTAKVNAVTGELASRVATGNSVTVVPPNGCFTPGEYYAAVLPGIIEAGAFTVALVREGSDIEGVPSAKAATLASAVSLPRNGGVKFSDTAAALEEVYAISDAAELCAWNAGSKTLNTMLLKDIDMNAVAWTPKALTKTFDGNGHCICNLVVEQESNAALFSSTSTGAVLKNLTLGSADGSTYDGVSRITVGKSAASTSFTYGAGLVAYINGTSTIENCRNFARVEASAQNVTMLRLGGIAGGSRNIASSILGCENAGEIVAAAGAELNGNSNMGGIVGWSDGAIGIKDCRNSGYVHSAHPRFNRVTGILGGSAAAVTLDNCDNSGTVEYSVAPTVAEPYVAGIVGDINNAEAIVRNCDNSGKVTLVDKSAEATTNIMLAGVCAKLGAVKEFSSNTNNALICNTAVCTKATDKFCGVIAGGIVAEVEGTDVTISDCKNLKNGAVQDNYSQASDTANPTKYIKLGGVVGLVSGKTTLTGCSNAALVQKITTAFGDAYVGGIVACLNAEGSRVENCSNTRWVGTTQTALGTGDVSSTKGGSFFVGGICGSCPMAADFDSCTNSGGVGQTGTVDKIYATYMYAGGIVGNVSAVVNCSKCSNSGEIKNIGKVLKWTTTGGWANTTDGLRIGGIIGAMNAGSGKVATISGCTNKGAVKNESANAKARQAIGGILGYASGGSAVVENCICDASLSSLCSTDANIYMGHVVGYIPYNNVTANNNGVSGDQTRTGGATTALTADNYSDHLWGLISGKTVTVTTLNYFYSSGLQTASLTERDDNQAW